MTNNLQGVWTALITPFKDDLSIDWKAFEILVADQVDAGVAGLVICGTTAESPTLSHNEKISLIKRAVELSQGRIQIMAGTGGNDTRTSIELSEEAMAVGANSLLIVTPPYNKPTQAGLIQHFEKIAESCKAPICLYHVPGRTAQKLTAEALAELTAIDHIDAVKEASGDLALFAKAVYLSRALYLSGDDPTYLASLSVGGMGCISVLSNIFPKEMVALTNKFFDGQVNQAYAIHRAFVLISEAIFCEANPGPVKYLLSTMKKCANNLRLPLVGVTDKSQQHLSAILAKTQKDLIGAFNI